MAVRKSESPGFYDQECKRRRKNKDMNTLQE